MGGDAAPARPGPSTAARDDTGVRADGLKIGAFEERRRFLPSSGASRHPSTPPRCARSRSGQALLPEGEGLAPSGPLPLGEGGPERSEGPSEGDLALPLGLVPCAEVP